MGNKNSFLEYKMMYSSLRAPISTLFWLFLFLSYHGQKMGSGLMLLHLYKTVRIILVCVLFFVCRWRWNK